MANIDAARQRIAKAALAAAASEGAAYADVRIVRARHKIVHAREQTALDIRDIVDAGLGVRVIAGGAWGFSATPVVDEALARDAARQAVLVARANALLRSSPVAMAPTAPVVAEWSTPIIRDPFDVPVQETVDLLLACNAEAMRAANVKYSDASLHAASEDKFFASSEGSQIQQAIYRIWPTCEAAAVSADGSDFQTCATFPAPSGQGYEYVDSLDMLGEARAAGVNAAAKLTAPQLVPGRRDLILYPSLLWLPIHESIGHATELDRALGFEANFAGTSFVTPDQLGTLMYGSPLVNVVGDRTLPHGLATAGYDDEGVATTRFDIIKDGFFVGFQTIREQAAMVGDAESHACAYADSYASVPMQRMPNVSLLPGSTPLSPDELIADVDDGLLIEGNGSWSIDMQRRNFQFGGQTGYLIKNGKIDTMARDFAFQASTVEFWNACDGICSAEYAAVGGTFNCGKGQPVQSAPVSHGSSPARFRNINTINTNTKK